MEKLKNEWKQRYEERLGKQPTKLDRKTRKAKRENKHSMLTTVNYNNINSAIILSYLQ
jgi:hypothetical protein